MISVSKPDNTSLNLAFRSRSWRLGHPSPPGSPPAITRFDPEHAPRLVTHPSHRVIQVTARYTALVGDPPLCWNSTHRRGFQAQRAGAQRSAEWRREGEVRRSLTTTMGRVQRPTTPTPSCRATRGGTPGPEVATLVQGRFKRDGMGSPQPR